MCYEKFLEAVISRLKEEFGDGCRFMPKEGLDINGQTRHSLEITSEASNISPNIRMDCFYHDYIEKRQDLNNVTEAVISIYKRNPAPDNFDAGSFIDWSLVRPKIRCHLISSGMNTELLATMPHRETLDLSVIYYVQTNLPPNITGTIHIHNEHMTLWGVEENDLHEAAWANMEREQDAIIEDMEDVIGKLFGKRWPGNGGEPGIPKMHILGHGNRMYGAVEMLNPAMLRKAADIIGNDFVILPSSLHEVILLPVSGRPGEMEDYQKMVRDVNDTQVSPDEILSYHVYRYFTETGKVEMAA